MLRGQSAIEFLMIIGFILVLILPLTWVYFETSAENTRIIQAQIAVEKLQKTADFVYYQGPGAKNVVSVYLPEGVEWPNSYIGKPGSAAPGVWPREIMLDVYTEGGSTEVWRATKGDLCGYWPLDGGNYRFIVKNTAECIYIGPYDLIFLMSPGSYSTTLYHSEVDAFTLTVTNLKDEAQTVDLTPGGGIADWITLSSYSVSVPANGQQTVTVTITAPSDNVTYPFDYYTGTVIGESDNVTLETYVYVVLTGIGGEIPEHEGIPGGLDVNILEPENTTYTESPIDLIFEVNDTIVWCGYSLNDGDSVPLAGNSSILVVPGEHKIELFCVGEEGKSGYDTEHFTVNFSIPEPWCFNLSYLDARNSTTTGLLPEVLYSDDDRITEELTQFGELRYVEVDYALSLPGTNDIIIIHNVSQWIEHYETSSQLSIVLQWRLSNGWGSDVCDLPLRFANEMAETVDMCFLTGNDAMKNPGKVERLSTRLFYLAHAAAVMDMYVDYERVMICYGAAMQELNIDSPVTQEYTVSPIYFNVSSNAWITEAWYSLDGAANQSMIVINNKEAYSVVGVGNGEHNVTFYATDIGENMKENSTTFTMNITAPDTVAPNITIVSPDNTTYYEQQWVWMNVTTNESANWCGYSLDGAANVTMGGSGMVWYYNASAPYNSHYVDFYCNDTIGNMGSSARRGFTTSAITYCVNLTLWNGFDSDGDNETTDLQASDDIRAEDAMTKNTDPEYITSQFSGIVPGAATIENATAYVEHYEDYASMDVDLQWNGGGWNDVCGFAQADVDTIDSCSLVGVDTVGEANSLDIRMEYIVAGGGPTTVRTVYVDHMRVEVCYTV